MNTKEAIAKAVRLSFGITTDFFCAFCDSLTKPKGFEATFGKERLIGNRFNKGFVYSRYRKLSRKSSHCNLLLVAVTGKGKSTRFITPTLFTLRQASLLIHDPSGELYVMSSGHLSKYFEVKVLNFSDYRVSCGYNFLSRISRPSDINKLAHLLISTSLDGGKGDPFWALAAKGLLQIFIRLLLRQPEEYRNIANIIQITRLFAATPQVIDKLVAKSNDEKLITDYKAAISASERTLQSIVSTLSAALEVYDTPDIAKVSAHDDIDFSSLRKKPQAIFLHSSVADLSFLATLSSAFFEQFYSHLLQKLPETGDLDVFCILDEAGILRIPLLPTILSNCRKYRNGNLISIQSKAQIKAFYKDEADTVTSNCITKIYLPGITDIDQLREIEVLSGKCTYKDDQGIQKTKQLVTTDEIRQLPDNRTLILSGSHPIIKGRSSPYFKSLLFRSYARITPLPMKGTISDEPMPLIR